MNNSYFETLNGIQGELTEELLIQRIADCNIILNELVNSKVWDIILKDSKRMIDAIDGSWHDIPLDSPKLREARVLKMASKMIIDLPMNYAQELDNLQEQLKKRQNPNIIEKDFDN